MFIGQKMNLKDMKTIHRLAVAITNVICLTLVSCSKESPNYYTHSMWSGEYPIQTVNGTTGEIEDHTGTMTLYFQQSEADCIVETGIVGLYAANRIRYEARWSGKTQFSLYSYSGGESMLCYSGTISEGELTLMAINCDSVAATYKLSRMPLLE